MTSAFLLCSPIFSKATFYAIGTRFFFAKVLKCENAKNHGLFGWFLTAAFPFCEQGSIKNHANFLSLFTSSSVFVSTKKRFPTAGASSEPKGKEIEISLTI